MYHVGRGGTGPGAKVGAVYEEDVDALQSEFSENADTVDPCPNNEDGGFGVGFEMGEGLSASHGFLNYRVI